MHFKNCMRAHLKYSNIFLLKTGQQKKRAKKIRHPQKNPWTVSFTRLSFIGSEDKSITE